MPSARAARSSTFAIAVGLVIAAMIGSAPPASADPLAVASFTCDERRDSAICDVYFSGGTGGNTYQWDEPTFHVDYPDHTKAVVRCHGYDSTQVIVTATDSSGSTVSAVRIAHCFQI